MPARQYSTPASIVYDLTSQVQTITGAGTTIETITGTTTNIFDNNLTSEYRVAGTGAGATSALIQFDWGRELHNCVLYSKYDLGAGTTTVLQYSSNGTDWTTLDAVQSAKTANYNIFFMRYIRFYATHNGAKAEVAVYELKLMGA